jgi:NodT family efflux transporter outer membrane factor (OMF) lipoprotein
MIKKVSTAWIMTVLCMMFAACAVGPDYVRPAASVPEAYKEIGDWKVAQPEDTTIRGRWWSIFDDQQLNDLEEQVSISNQTIVAAEAQYREALALVQAARASYFPFVIAGVSFTRALQSSTLSSSPAAGSVPTSNYLLPVNVSWEADVWGRIRRTVEASRSNAQASATDLESIRLSVRAALAQAYFQLRTVDAQTRLLDETAAAYKKALELTQNRYGSGVAGKTDVLQAETQLNTTQAQLIDLGVQRAQLEHAMAVLVGKPASVFSLDPMPLAAITPAVPVGVPSELLERRPDIAGAERRMAAANAQIGVAKAAYFPRVTLSATGGYESDKSSTWLTWPSHFWSLGPAIAETLFDGGLRSAQSAQAKALYDAAVASYRQTVLTGFQEVEDNLAASRILEEEARMQDMAVKSAQQSLTLTSNQYKAGTVSYLNVILAQTTALTNERAAVDIAGRRMIAAVLLVKALGGGWETASSAQAAP